MSLMKSFWNMFGLVILSILPLTGCDSDSSPPPPREGFSPRIQLELEMKTQQLFQELGVPGVMIGIWVPGVGSWTRALGVANRDTGEPIQFNQHVRIGSITKTFTTELILLLADEGLLNLNDPISKYVTGIPNGDQITLRQLGNMTSGLAT